jgi:hypothetical protein
MLLFLVGLETLLDETEVESVSSSEWPRDKENVTNMFELNMSVRVQENLLYERELVLCT